jgi:hemolysin activation/secretion protein
MLLPMLSLSGPPIMAADVPCRPGFVAASGSYAFAEKTAVEYGLPANAVIGKVHITNLDVFDESNPRENNALYRFANRVHIRTKPGLLKRQVLFGEGDSYDPRLVRESARILRARKYLYDADVRPVSACEGKVDVEVITRDVWSLTVDASFDRAGGENKFGFGLRETNLFGRGAEVSIKTKQDIDRDTNEFAFKSDNLGGSRLKSRIRYADSDDGSEQYALLELPFYSLDSRRAWSVSLRHAEQIDTQFLRGDDVTEVEHEIDDYRLSYGISSGLKSGLTQRWAMGYWYRRSQFDLSDELAPPSEFPIDKEMSFPFLEYSLVEDSYVQRVNINQFERTEDLHVGRRFYARLGYSAEAFGGDEDRIVYEGGYSDTLFYSSRHMLRHEFSFSGLRDRDQSRTEDLIFDYELRYILTASKHRSYLAEFRGAYSKNLNSHQQVVLGGDTGLRAFENRFQVGDRRVSLNLERRTFTDIHLFNLIRIGWAFFIDVGRAWDPDVKTDFEDEYLANVGFGLRLASSKADVGRFMHIDLAFPLTNRDDRDVDSSLLSVRLTNRF